MNAAAVDHSAANAPSDTPGEDTFAAFESPVGRRWLNWVDRHRLWILGAVALLHLAGINGQWRLTSDSAYHATIARRLVTGQGYTTHHETAPLNVNPGLPVLIAAHFAVFGDDTLWPAILLVHALAGLTLVLIYRWATAFADRPTAVLLVAMVGLNAVFYRHALTLLTDIPFLLGVMLFLLGFEWLRQQTIERRWRIAGGTMMLGGVLVMGAFRSVVLTFLAGAAAALIWDVVRHRRWKAALGGAGGLTAGLLVLFVMDPRRSNSGGTITDERIVYDQLVNRLPETLERAWSTNLPELLADALPKATLGTQMHIIPGAIFCLALAWMVFTLWQHRPLWTLIAAAFVVQLVLFFVSSRHLLPLVPILALAWWLGSVWLSRRMPEKAAPWVLGFMLCLWFTPNLARTGKVLAEQRATPFLAEYKDGRYLALRELGEAIEQQTPENALILMDFDWQEELGFFARRTVDPLEWRRDLKAIDSSRPLFAVLPAGSHAGRFANLPAGWTLGPALCEIPSQNKKQPEPWRLHELKRP